MSSLLLLLLCTKVLGAPKTLSEEDATVLYAQSETTALQTNQPPTEVARLPQSPSTSLSPSPSPSPSSSPSPLPSHSPSPSTSSSPAPILKEWFNVMINKRECRPVLLVTGGLMVVCTILLVSTLLLSCKVCQQSRRIMALTGNADLISNCEYRMGTVKNSKSNAEPEPKETNVLLADHSQTQEETANGTTKEEGGKATEGEQTGEEGKKEEGDAAKSEEASTTPGAVTEDSPSSKPQEEAADPPPTDSVETSTPEGTEEPKEVV